MATIKEQKEAFVTGHSGTSPWEVMLICSSAPIGIFLFLEINYYLFSLANTKKTKKRHKASENSATDANEGNVGWQRLALFEVLFLIFPMILCQTKFLNPYGTTLLISEVTLAVYLHIARREGSGVGMNMQPEEACSRPRSSETPEQIQQQTTKNFILPYLTAFRSTVYMLTFIAILAVDFHIFPRRFAKTEVSGYGLMDVGASSFIISGGFVSSYARRGRRQCHLSSLSDQKKEADATKNKAQWIQLFMHEMKYSLRKSIPLIVLGVIRIGANKGVDYQEHITEYGTNWNVFFTLAVVGVTSTVFRCCIEIASHWPGWGNYLLSSVWGRFFAPMGMLGLYQCMLSSGLQDYIENGSRYCSSDLNFVVSWGKNMCDFFAANREGILGCVGYIALHMLSEDIAQLCIWNSGNRRLENDRKSDVTGRKATCMTDQSLLTSGEQLLICCVALWTNLVIQTTVFQVPVSRRTTNLPFITWSLAHNVTILFLTWTAFYISGRKNIPIIFLPKSPPIFSAVNRNGLMVFLAANLLTGAVNLGMNTLAASDWKALLALIVYMTSIGGLAIVLDKFLDITIKI